MNDDLHRYLDGDLRSDGLPRSERGEAEAWERLLDAYRAASHGSEAPQAPPWLEDRVMAGIEALPEPRLWSRVLVWLLTPRPMSVSPVVLGAAVAVFAAVVVLPWRGVEPVPPMGGGAPPVRAAAVGDVPVVYVQFRLHAPGARSVAVVGDFTDWSVEEELSDPDGDGVWSGRVPVRPGVHAYMFVVDGSEWVTDPDAERFRDDGFGSRNAVLAVPPPQT